MHCIINHKEELLSCLERINSARLNHAFVLVAEASKKDFESIFLKLINQHKINIYGGVFPSLIFNSKIENKGVIIWATNSVIKAKKLSLASDEEQMHNEIRSFKLESAQSTPKTLLTFISAFGSHKAAFLKSVYNQFGNTMNYFGAGCGSVTDKNDKEIITNKGLFSNSALVIELADYLNLNYAHGWDAFPEVHKVTEYEGNEIVSINWEPAFNVYKKIIEQEAKLNIDAKNFVDISKRFPFGILRLDGYLIIRDPYGITPRNGILTLDKIEEGEFIKIMCGDSKSLINAAKKLNANTNQTVLCFNCISRKLFHEENINKELQQIQNQNLIGAFSVGEIVNHGDVYLEMFNKIVATATW
ncbi:FIST signal transduction protein [Psychroflexus salis]|uniref:FIST C-domain domain-containing protein n=1 Tax=Psychroflexus salis TaxID=1526574 RepID=A0A916ZV37_9FLAO|nr:FIST C-terminal domain-containing protein [Psychroflexus salis]GGE14214.1 hypothetical protein GCM10010831_14480 [Psychroflexus salis]